VEVIFVGLTLMRRAVVAGVLIALSASPASAQTADDLAALRKDINTLKEGQSALLRELEQIKNLLSAAAQAGRAAAAPEVVLTVGDAPSKGKKDARLTLVEFTDYQ
jgi:protein-disulfide isomerase